VKKTIESQERIYNTINREYFGYQRLLWYLKTKIWGQRPPERDEKESYDQKRPQSSHMTRNISSPSKLWRPTTNLIQCHGASSNL
jgi:hypothetical protein